MMVLWIESSSAVVVGRAFQIRQSYVTVLDIVVVRG